MYTIDVLIPFNLLIDTDMGLIKLVQYEYHDETYFLPGIMYATEMNQKYILARRAHPNPLTVLLRDEYEYMADNLYQQFMEQEYDRILSLSGNTPLSDLTALANLTSDQIVRITVQCNDDREKKLLTDRGITPHRVIISKPEDINLSSFGSLYAKNVEDLDRYTNIDGKNIYIPNYEFNVYVDENVPELLIKEDTILKYGKNNEFYVFTYYNFGPKDIPNG